MAIQYVPCINGQPVVLPAGAWACSNTISPNTDPITPPVMPIACGRHQAPAGYYYKLVAGKCMLWKRSPNTPVRTQAGTGFIYQNPTANIGATVTNTVSGFTNWLQNNKGLALALAAGGYYLFTKK